MERKISMRIIAFIPFSHSEFWNKVSQNHSICYKLGKSSFLVIPDRSENTPALSYIIERSWIEQRADSFLNLFHSTMSTVNLKVRK